MILTDREIRLALETGRLIIKPEPDASRYSATSIDLTLADVARRWITAPNGVEMKLAPGRPEYNHHEVAQQLTEPIELTTDGFTISPREFVLAWTMEAIELPVEYGIAARVEGKSSLGRIGIGVHVTAPTIHAGFKGPIQLEVVNHGPNPVILTPGMRICQLIFELTMGTPDKAYDGQFREQRVK